MKILVNIGGESGVGKSFLVRQCTHDPDFGPDKVLVVMHEDSRLTYGAPLPHIKQATTLESAYNVFRSLADAAKAGNAIPPLIVWDSLTGATDYFQADKEENPNMVPIRVDGKPTGESVRDKRSEFGELGTWAQRCYLVLRNEIPSDVVVLWTTYGAEIAAQGNVIPRNVNRWSSATLYMQAKEDRDDPAAIAAYVAENGQALNRSYGKDAAGNFNGQFITRYFHTQYNGEIRAKGHDALSLTERAILPDVLRKIHAWGKKTEVK